MSKKDYMSNKEKQSLREQGLAHPVVAIDFEIDTIYYTSDDHLYEFHYWLDKIVTWGQKARQREQEFVLQSFTIETSAMYSMVSKHKNES